MARKVIKRFILDTGNISINGDTRSFTIVGDPGAVFSLEILNEDTTPTYYNFATQTFSTTKAGLRNITLTGNQYKNFIKFPVVGDADHYDIRLFAEHGYDTFHASYNEVRFPDGSIDINSSTGSNSSLLMKKIYQYADTTITLSAVSPNSVTEWGSVVITTDSVTGVRFGALAKYSFSIVVTAASNRSIRILNQPNENSLTAYVQRNIGSAEAINNEDIYPAVSNTDTVDGAITGGGSTVKVVMDTNVADKMVVGDKITAATTTDTVDGTFSGTKVVMDNNVAGKMAIGDQITGNTTLDGKPYYVTALNPDGDNVKEFQMSASAEIADGTTLTFTPKCNRSLTTVSALNPDGDNAKEFQMSQNIGFVDGVTLSFSNQKNYQWNIGSDSSVHGLAAGMLAVGTNITAGSRLANYTETSTVTTAASVVKAPTSTTEGLFLGPAPITDTKGGEKLGSGEIQVTTKKVFVPAVTPLGSPTLTDGVVSAQLGNIVFDKQQALVLADDNNIKFYTWGPPSIEKLTNMGVKVSNLKVALTDVTTTVNDSDADGATALSTFDLASVQGLIDDFSVMSGVNIKASGGTPTISNISSSTITVSPGDHILQNGQTLTFKGSSRIATITGEIEVTKFPEADTTIYFDLETFLNAV